MSESPLMVKSKTFALEVIRACRVLREAKCESALINQFYVREQALVQTSAKQFMHMAKQILWRSYILPSRNAPKPNIGLSF